MFVSWVTDPVDLRIPTDGLVEGVDADHLVELESRVLGNPVGVEDTKRFSDASTNSFLSDSLEITFWLQLVDTMVLGLTVSGTLWRLLLSATTSDTNTVDDKALLGLVTQTAGFLWS